MGIFDSGVNPGAYRGELTCPWDVYLGGQYSTCGSKSIRFVESVSRYRLRYRCRKCGRTFQYDISNRHDLNPYATYQKGKIWSDIMKVTRGRQLKGAFK